MSHPMYNPHGGPFPSGQRTVVTGQYVLGSHSGLDLAGARLDSDSLSSFCGEITANQLRTLGHPLGQHQAKVPIDLDSTLALYIQEAREEVPLQTQMMKPVDPILKKDKDAAFPPTGSGLAANSVPGRSANVDWSNVQTSSEHFASCGVRHSFSSSQHFKPSGFGDGGEQSSFDSQPSSEYQLPRYNPERANSILAKFGLSIDDLEFLSLYPDDELTPENLPHILRDIRRLRSKRNNDHLPLESQQGTVTDDGHSSKPGVSEEKADSHELACHSKESSKFEMDIATSSVSNIDQTKPCPISTSTASVSKRTTAFVMMKDYSAVTPKIFPHTCSLCNLKCAKPKDWIKHQNTSGHIENCQRFRKEYPNWKATTISFTRAEEEHRPKRRSGFPPRKSRGLPTYCPRSRTPTRQRSRSPKYSSSRQARRASPRRNNSSRSQRSSSSERLAKKLLESSELSSLSDSNSLETIVQSVAPALLAEFTKKRNSSVSSSGKGGSSRKCSTSPPCKKSESSKTSSTPAIKKTKDATQSTKSSDEQIKLEAKRKEPKPVIEEQLSKMSQRSNPEESPETSQPAKAKVIAKTQAAEEIQVAKTEVLKPSAGSTPVESVKSAKPTAPLTPLSDNNSASSEGNDYVVEHESDPLNTNVATPFVPTGRGMHVLPTDLDQFASIITLLPPLSQGVACFVDSLQSLTRSREYTGADYRVLLQQVLKDKYDYDDIIKAVPLLNPENDQPVSEKINEEGTEKVSSKVTRHWKETAQLHNFFKNLTEYLFKIIGQSQDITSMSSCRQEEMESMECFISRFNTAWVELVCMGLNSRDQIDLYINTFLNNVIPSNAKIIKLNVLNRHELSIDSFHNALRNLSAKGAFDKPEPSAKADSVPSKNNSNSRKCRKRGRKKRKVTYCYCCGKPGHWGHECRNRMWYLEHSNFESNQPYIHYFPFDSSIHYHELFD